MDSPLVSIIVPIYKVEPYLRKCVDSILAQTYTNIEVILIDDGSPDGCPAICDEYEVKDPRVVVIHQKNAGVSAARNAGLDRAKGEYIAFVDSDDWIEPDMFEVLMKVAQKTGSDIAVSSFCRDDDHVTFCEDENIITLSSHDAVRDLFFDRYNLCSAWGKVYRSTLFGDVRFPIGITIAEDTLVSFQTIIISNSLSYVNYNSYHYIASPNSAMHKFRETFWSIQDASDILVERTSKYDSGIICCAEKRSIQADIGLAILAADGNMLTKESYEKVVNHISKYKTKESYRLLGKNYKCWLKLLTLGRMPFIFGRRVYRMIKHS